MKTSFHLFVALFAIVLLCGAKTEKKKTTPAANAATAKKKKADRAPAAATTHQEPTALGGVCDASAGVGLCYAFSGQKNTEESTLNTNKETCKLMRGLFSPGTGICPKPKRLGHCTVVEGSPDEYVVFYYSGKFDSGKATSDCKNAKSPVHSQGAGSWKNG